MDFRLVTSVALRASFAVFMLAMHTMSLSHVESADLTTSEHDESKFTFKGPEACKLCHDKSKPEDMSIEAGKHLDFVALNESLIHDRHQKAFTFMCSDRGFDILRRMEIDDVEQVIDQLTRINGQEPCDDDCENTLRGVRQCLSCHANWRPDRTYPNLRDYFRHGVSCESCHGASDQWEDEHKLESWREKTAEEKQELGMINVRDPVCRAEQCVSCHIGNVEQGKVVTHRMYAAGHPILPNFELGTFTMLMPVHWRELSEKGGFLSRDKFIEATYPNGYPGFNGDFPVTRAIWLGSNIGLREYVRLVRDLARVKCGQAKPPTDITLGWPELAIYDCFACHHDLKTNIPRNRNRYQEAPPGRVPLAEWQTSLSLSPMDPDLDTLFRDLRMAIVSQPFGDAERIHVAADAVIDQLTVLREKLEVRYYEKEYGAEIVENHLTHLLSQNKQRHYGFPSARQVSWAARAMTIELISLRSFPQLNGKLNKASANPERFELGKIWLRDYEKWRQQKRAGVVSSVDMTFKNLDKMLVLSMNPGTESGGVEKLTSTWLRALADYDPEDFQLTFQKTIEQVINR